MWRRKISKFFFSNMWKNLFFSKRFCLFFLSIFSKKNFQKILGFKLQMLFVLAMCFYLTIFDWRNSVLNGPLGFSVYFRESNTFLKHQKTNNNSWNVQWQKESLFILHFSVGFSLVNSQKRKSTFYTIFFALWFFELFDFFKKLKELTLNELHCCNWT